ncbi:MAG: hypothetical protein ACFFDN_41015 [Candidatus Hodarchaeota archaeon]
MDLSKIAIIVVEGIFSGKDIIEIENKSYKVKVFTKSGLRYVDLEGYRIIEQNPNKSSKWAKMAREGKKIAWIFKGREYYAKVVDGHFTLLRSK